MHEYMCMGAGPAGAACRLRIATRASASEFAPATSSRDTRSRRTRGPARRACTPPAATTRTRAPHAVRPILCWRRGRHARGGVAGASGGESVGGGGPAPGLRRGDRGGNGDLTAPEPIPVCAPVAIHINRVAPTPAPVEPRPWP